MDNEEQIISKALGECHDILSINTPKSAPDAVIKIMQQIKTTLSKLPNAGKEIMLKPILNPAEYNEMQLKIIETINEGYSQHYTIRKEVIRTRLDVTTESMLESERAKENVQNIHNGLAKRLGAFQDIAHIETWTIFAAQNDLFRIDKITRLTNDVASTVRKHRIGMVPDRGGRTDEVRQVEIAQIPFELSGGGDHRGRGRGRGRGRSRGHSHGHSHGHRGGNYQRRGRGRGNVGY